MLDSEVIQLVEHDFFQLLRGVAWDLVDLGLALLRRQLSVKLLEVRCCHSARKTSNLYTLSVTVSVVPAKHVSSSLCVSNYLYGSESQDCALNAEHQGSKYQKAMGHVR